MAQKMKIKRLTKTRADVLLFVLLASLPMLAAANDESKVRMKADTTVTVKPAAPQGRVSPIIATKLLKRNLLTKFKVVDEMTITTPTSPNSITQKKCEEIGCSVVCGNGPSYSTWCQCKVDGIYTNTLIY